MAGLLDYVIGGALEGGGKAVKDSFEERAKQEALALREENLARYQSVANIQTADLAQRNALKVQAGEQTFKRDVEMPAAADEAQAERDTRMGINSDNITAQKDLQAEGARIQEKLLRLGHKLTETEPGTVGKLYQDLTTSVKLSPTTAQNLIAATLGKGTAPKEKDQALAWAKVYYEDLNLRTGKGVIPATDEDRVASEQAATKIRGWSPPGIIPKEAPATEFDDILWRVGKNKQTAAPPTNIPANPIVRPPPKTAPTPNVLQQVWDAWGSAWRDTAGSITTGY